MASYSRDFTVQLEEEEDVEVEVNFDVTHWGAPATPPSYASGGDPPEAPEIEVLSALRTDDGADIWEALSAEAQRKIEEEILDNLSDYDDGGPEYEPDYD